MALYRRVVRVPSCTAAERGLQQAILEEKASAAQLQKHPDAEVAAREALA